MKINIIFEKAWFYLLALLSVIIKSPVYATRLSKLAINKKQAMDFYDLAFNQNKPQEAILRYVGASYIQHNPHVKDGKTGFIEYFTRMAEEYPNKKVYFKRVFAEQNYVILHCLQEWPGDVDWASIDIFRFDNRGKIIEHWDVLQKLPEKSANKNTLF